MPPIISVGLCGFNCWIVDAVPASAKETGNVRRIAAPNRPLTSILLAAAVALNAAAACVPAPQPRTAPVTTTKEVSAALVALTVTPLTAMSPTQVPTVTVAPTPTVGLPTEPLPASETPKPTETPTPSPAEATATPEEPKVKIEVDNMNVRSGNGTNFGVIDHLPKGTAVEVLAKSANGWLRIEWTQGGKEHSGWVNGSPKYVTVDEAVEAMPIAKPEELPPTPTPMPLVGYLIANTNAFESPVSLQPRGYLAPSVIDHIEVLGEAGSRYPIRIYSSSVPGLVSTWWIDKSMTGLTYILGAARPTQAVAPAQSEVRHLQEEDPMPFPDEQLGVWFPVTRSIRPIEVGTQVSFVRLIGCDISNDSWRQPSGAWRRTGACRVAMRSTSI